MKRNHQGVQEPEILQGDWEAKGRPIPEIPEIKEWLRAKLAQYMDMKPEQIDSKELFLNYGLDSITAVALAGDLEDWLGFEMSVSITYTFPNIDALAEYIAKHFSRNTPT